MTIQTVSDIIRSSSASRTGVHVKQVTARMNGGLLAPGAAAGSLMT